MSDTFDINNRETWDWVDGIEVRADSSPKDSDYKLDPTSPHHFYQISNGVPHRQACPDGLVFNPSANPGPVCDHPWNCSEADIYDWAVSVGLVNDQR